MEGLVNCYQEKFGPINDNYKQGAQNEESYNIFIANESIDVIWGDSSVLFADLLCQQKLLKQRQRLKEKVSFAK